MRSARSAVLELSASLSWCLLLLASSACTPLSERRWRSLQESGTSAEGRVQPDEASTMRDASVPSRVHDEPSGGWWEVGRSFDDRPIRLRTVGQGRRRVLLIGGIHGNEREGRVVADRIADTVIRSPDLSARATLTVVEDLNPDGTARGRRGNARGVDLNRNFPSSNRPPQSPALTEPEAQLLHDLIVDGGPDAVIVLHSWGRKPTGPTQFINYDGPGADLARVFATIHPDYPVRESRHLPSTPGSLGSWVGKDLQIPIFTIEYPRGLDPVAAWNDTREGLLALVRG